MYLKIQKHSAGVFKKTTVQLQKAIWCFIFDDDDLEVNIRNTAFMLQKALESYCMFLWRLTLNDYVTVPTLISKHRSSSKATHKAIKNVLMSLSVVLEMLLKWVKVSKRN